MKGIKKCSCGSKAKHWRIRAEALWAENDELRAEIVRLKVAAGDAQ